MSRVVPVLSIAFLTAVGSSSASAQWSTEALSQARQELVAVTVGDYALFAGGRNQQTTSRVVDIYDASTNTWEQAELSLERGALAATVVGDFALFAGGAFSGTTDSDVVDIFDAKTKAWSTAKLSQARFGLSAATVGNKALFAGGGVGGINNPNAVPSAVVDIYDASKGLPDDPAAWSTDVLIEARGLMGAASVGTEALFAGGFTGAGFVNTVDIYDCVTGTWRTSTLSEARGFATSQSTTAGTKAYFAGGRIDQVTMSDVVDIYDAVGGTWSSVKLSVPRMRLAATTLGNKVMFAGGVNYESGFVRYDVVNVLMADTGTWGPQQALSLARADLAATTVGGRALFAGGFGGGSTSAIVDVYQPAGVTYCTAKSQLVCGTPAIGATGCPSASASEGFDVHASPARANRAGLLLYTNSGRASLPFQGGTLCLSPAPLRRSAPINSGGSGQCDGVFAIDMNCFASGSCGGNPEGFLTIVGEKINCQFWGRDSVATGSFLSDGLEYYVGP